MRSEPSPDACSDCEMAKLRCGSGTRPSSPSGRPIDYAEEPPHGHLGTVLEPRAKLLPAPVVHAGLAPLAALSATDEKGTALRIETCLRQVERFVNAEPRTPQDDDQTAYPRAVRAGTGLAHDRDDLLHSRWVRRVAQSLVSRRAACVVAPA